MPVISRRRRGSVIGVVVGHVQGSEHAGRGAADQDGAVVDVVIVHAGLGQGGDVNQAVAAQEIVDEVQAVRGEIHQGAAAGAGAVGAPVGLGPLPFRRP